MGLFRRKKRAPTDDPTLSDHDVPAAASESTADADPAAEVADLGPAPLEAFEMLLDREWARIAGPGTWWTGAERVAIATDARRRVDGEEPSGALSAPAEEATRRVAVDAAEIRDTDVARWDQAGLDPFAYVELVGIVSRMMALDVTAFGLGRRRRPLPEAALGEPTGEKPDRAEITTGWAPTIGPATAPSSLSAVPAEAAGMWDLHGTLYLELEQMLDLQAELDGLSRPQIELVAARTSVLNDCFY